MSHNIIVVDMSEVQTPNFARGYSFKQTFGLGTTLYVFMILSGYSSLIFETRRVPIPVMIRLVFDSVVIQLNFLAKDFSLSQNSIEAGLPEPVPPPREGVSWKP